MKWLRWQSQRQCICLRLWPARGGTCGWCFWGRVWRCVHTMFSSGWATCPGGSESPGASFGGMLMPCPTVHTEHMQVLVIFCNMIDMGRGVPFLAFPSSYTFWQGQEWRIT